MKKMTAVFFARLFCRVSSSFSWLEIAQIYSHLINTGSRFLSASGLRLETAQTCDKQKAEFYFRNQIKIILTKNPNGSLPT
jgi:hypothetical protein